MPAWNVTAFYKFVAVNDPQQDQAIIRSWMQEFDVRGLVVLAPEGINGTVACQGGLCRFKKNLLDRYGSLEFKDSASPKPPFKRISVDIRSEIVGMKRPELVPGSEGGSHLAPEEWHDRLQQHPIVIDTRNQYETKLGMFRGAIDPGLSHFSEWPAYLDAADLPKDQPILIYCTGGIRCEKAILAMQERGYTDVHQLRGGILGYLSEYPEGDFQGECFVFDERVAVDRNLQPTSVYGICPGCGLTSGTRRTCANCNADYFTCEACGWDLCSKRCQSEVEARSRRSRGSLEATSS